MAIKIYETCLVVVLGLMLCRVSTAQSNSTCSNEVASLSSCLNYVRGNVSKPTQQCCASLATSVQAQPECVCPLLNQLNSGSYPVNFAINQTLAMALPALCKVQTPSLSQCSVAEAPPPSTYSLDSPTYPSPTEPAQSPTTEFIPSDNPPSGTGSTRTVSSTSNGSIKASSINLAVVFLSVVAWISKSFIF